MTDSQSHKEKMVEMIEEHETDRMGYLLIPARRVGNAELKLLIEAEYISDRDEYKIPISKNKQVIKILQFIQQEETKKNLKRVDLGVPHIW
jgi:hypothetical protein